MSYRRIKTLRSYATLARFIAELPESPAGYIPRPNIPSPFRYSPAQAVYAWNGKTVFWLETSHRVYEIFELSPDTLFYASDDDATEAYIAARQA